MRRGRMGLEQKPAVTAETPRRCTSSGRSTQPLHDDRQRSSDRSQSLFQIRVKKLSFRPHSSASVERDRENRSVHEKLIAQVSDSDKKDCQLQRMIGSV